MGSDTIKNIFIRLMALMHRPIYAARLQELVKSIVPHLEEGDQVLDVGCGCGTLGYELMRCQTAPGGLLVVGIERCPRDGEPIRVDAYDGRTFPYSDRSFDVVILADVLHHESDPDHLLQECMRVSRRFLIIKDHKVEGLFGRLRVSLMDWAANAPYDVPCLYRYWTRSEWEALRVRPQFKMVEERHSMCLYPPAINQLFGGRLQYFAVIRISEPA